MTAGAWKNRVQALWQKAWETHGQARWQSLTARERWLVAAAISLLGVWLFVGVAITPAVRVLQTSNAQRDQFAQQMAQMRSLQWRAQALRKTVALSRDESLKTLQGMTPAGNAAIQLSLQGDRVVVTLKNVSALQLGAWLAQARNQAQALPQEVHITRAAASAANASSAAVGTATAATAIASWDGQLVMRLPLRQTPMSPATSGSQP
jgi:general secretion pathway protein M